MPHEHHPAMPQVTAVDDQFGTHTSNVVKLRRMGCLVYVRQGWISHAYGVNRTISVYDKLDPPRILLFVIAKRGPLLAHCKDARWCMETVSGPEVRTLKSTLQATYPITQSHGVVLRWSMQP